MVDVVILKTMAKAECEIGAIDHNAVLRISCRDFQLRLFLSYKELEQNNAVRVFCVL